MYEPKTNAFTVPDTRALMDVVDRLFHVANKDTVTIKDVMRSVASHFDIPKVTKEMKLLIRGRLTDLMQGETRGENEENEFHGEESQGATEAREKDQAKKSDKKKKNKHSITQDAVASNDRQSDNEVSSTGFAEAEDGQFGLDEGNDSSSDYEDHTRSSRKKDGKTKRKSRKIKHDDGEMTDNSTASSIEIKSSKGKGSNKKPLSTNRRSSRSSSKAGKMAKRIRDSATKARLRQIEEARIRQEELGHLAKDDVESDGSNQEQKRQKSAANKEEEECSGPQLSEQDRQRALAIAARFDTNREELRVKREEDRAGLIERLRQKRLESITLKEFAEQIKNEDGSEVGVKDTAQIFDKSNTNVEPHNLKEEMLQLTASNNPVAGKGIIPVKATETTDVVGSYNDEDDSKGDDSNDELEIVVPTFNKTSNLFPFDTASSNHKSGQNVNIKGNVLSSRKGNSASILDFLLSKRRDGSVAPVQFKKRSKPLANPRAALRNVLRAKQIQAGNRWLAR